jgi:hypothetical protein
LQVFTFRDVFGSVDNAVDTRGETTCDTGVVEAIVGAPEYNDETTDAVATAGERERSIGSTSVIGLLLAEVVIVVLVDDVSFPFSHCGCCCCGCSGDGCRLIFSAILGLEIPPPLFLGDISPSL